MTTLRDLVALLLLVVGAGLLVVAASLWGGWPAGLAGAGVLMVGGGVLLGIAGPDQPLITNQEQARG